MSSQLSDPAADTVLSASASTVRPYSFPETPTPPDSSLDNSPLDSPFSDSISSLPSVSSSFFFSSAAASPPRSHSSQPDNADTQGLIIPSLTLPTALHRSTPYGQTLGDLRVLVLVHEGADTSLVPALLSDLNEDIVDVGEWEQTEHGRRIKASTDWVDAHGLERFEPLRNVEFAEFPAYDSETDVDKLIYDIRHYVQGPFQCLSEVLHPKHHASSVLSNLLSSPYSPLYTALILLLPPSQTPDSLDFRIVDNLGAHVPIITLPTLLWNVDHNQDQSYRTQLPVLSSFQPRSLAALRAGLFRSPETVALLRSEAADRFMRWREIESAVADIYSVRNGTYSPDASGSVTTNDNLTSHSSPSSSWNKAKWESEWMPSFSIDVAKRIREGTITQRSPEAKRFIFVSIENPPEQTTETAETSRILNAALAHEKRSSYTPKTCSFAETFPAPAFGRSAMYDPLHFPSLLIFSISLLGPLKERFDGSLSFFWDALEQVQVKVALIGGFVIGIGVGLAIR